MRVLDGSVEEYLEAVRGVAGERAAERPLSRRYEAAAFVAEAEEAGVIGRFSLEGYPFPAAGPLLPSRRVLYHVLGASGDEEAYRRLSGATEGGGGLVEAGFREFFEEAGRGLELLPAVRFYEGDGGLYMNSGVFVACMEGACNASIHRVMVSDDYSYAAVRVVPRHLYHMLTRSPRGLPVAVAEGLDPRILLAAATSPPLGVFELEEAPGLLGAGLRVCRTPRYGLPVPCGASLVVEARLGPDRAPEGPFVDLLGLYDKQRMEPVLHVEKVYVNKVHEPIVHVLLPGGTEHMLLMGLPREAAIYDAVRRAVPRVAKVRLTRGGGMWLHAVVAIEKQHDGDGKTAGLAALAAHPSLKHVVVVDSDIDPDVPWMVEWAIATRLQADRGVVVIPHARGSTLDPSAREGLTAKLVIDATAPVAERERYRRPRIPGRG